MTITWTAKVTQVYPRPDCTQLFLKEDDSYWPDIAVPNDCFEIEVGDEIVMETESIRYISITVAGKGTYRWPAN